MANFHDRLNEALDRRNMSAAELSRVTGIGEGSISQYKKGAYKATQRNLEILAAALRVSIPWLMGADVPMEGELFKSPTVTDDVIDFPVIGALAAGYDHLAVQDLEADHIKIPTEALRGRPASDYFVLRVTGDSMYPLYQEGDKVLILRQETLNRSGQIGVVIYDDDQATLKKIEYVMGEDWMRLVPINPSYPPIMVTGERLEHCKVLGIPRLLIREIRD